MHMFAIIDLLFKMEMETSIQRAEPAGSVEQNKTRFKIDTETISQQRKIKRLSTLR